jgi:hypothetical protein
MRAGAIVAAVCLLFSACSEDRPPAAPTPLPPVVIDVPPAPVARLGLMVDGRGSLVAIQNLSNVRLDATGSSGTGLRYSLDFGDGTGADRPTAEHVYPSGGRTYTVRAIVTDSLGRSDTATLTLTVRGVEGRWTHSFSNPNARRFESRTLEITSQNGVALTGLYTHPEGYTSPFTGELRPERGVVLELQGGGIQFTGDDSSGFNSEATRLSVHLRGGSASGLTLIFQRSQ